MLEHSWEVDLVSVMNAVRDVQMRWINAVGPPTERDFRGLAAVAAVSVAVFAGFFVIGHATVATSTPRSTPAPTLPISYTGAVVPTHLAAAPPIATIAVARTGTRGRSRRKGNASVPAPAAATPVTRSVAPSAPTPAPTPSPVSQPAPTTTPAHHPKPHKGGGVSFDSSG